MASSAKDHYDSHLASIYTWMRGGAALPREQFAAQLAQLNLLPSRSGATVLDLGAGSGFQSLPLAAAGYAVTAVDLSEILLAELARDATTANLTFPIRTILGDLRDLTRHAPSPAPDLIVCMGDTITHLASLDDVSRLLSDSAVALAPGGHLLLSFRDYTTARTGTDRFIPVRSDADRIFTCFLEFGPTHLNVHDIVHARVGDSWLTTVSVFEKLRLSPDFVRAQLAAAGFTLVSDTSANGLITLAARRASA